MGKLNVGIIGYSWVASAHIKVINDGGFAQVTAIYSSRAHNDAKLSKEYGLEIKTYTDLEEMLKDSSIGAVCIRSYNYQHREQAVAAASAGKHICLGKPIALAWEDCLVIEEAVAKANVKFRMGFECSYSKQFIVTKAVLDQGLIGELYDGEVDYLHCLGPSYKQFPWNSKKEDGVSALLTAGCHALDALLLFLGSDEEEVTSYDGFEVVFYDTVEEFYLAEALEFTNAWRKATEENPLGICGPIGPSEQLPLVALLVNELGISLKHAHFWCMDEWVIDGKEVSEGHPLSFKKAFKSLCLNRMNKDLVMPDENLHFAKTDTTDYAESWNHAKCLVMQGGQGDVKHWSFNEHPKREGKYMDDPPSVEEYKKHDNRIFEFHPITIAQNSRLHCGRNTPLIPTHAVTVGPKETWQTEQVSIWHAGAHDNPFGQRLTTCMISNNIPDTSVPMPVLVDHPNVQPSFLRQGLGTCSVEMH